MTPPDRQTAGETDGRTDADSDGNPPPSESTTAAPTGKAHRWTSETAKEARKLRRPGLQPAQAAKLPPSDAEIERGLREKAKTDPRAAEVLLRWLSRPTTADPASDPLSGLSPAQLHQLHCGLTRLLTMEESAMEAVVRAAVAEAQP